MIAKSNVSANLTVLGVFVVSISLISGIQTTFAATKPIVVTKQATFNTNINLQGNTLDFNKGGSKIYDDGQLHLATDDYLYLNAPNRTFVQNDFQLGNTLVIANSVEQKDTGSKLYDNGNLHISTDDFLHLDATRIIVQNELQAGNAVIINNKREHRDTGSKIYDDTHLHIATDDYLYLDAPNTTFVQNALTVGGAINFPTGAIDSAEILDGTILNADIANGAAIADSKLATISTAGKVDNSATTATSSNIISTIVLRDGSGNFSAGAITSNGALTVAGGQNLVLASGTGQIQQTFTTTSGVDASAISYALTNSGAGVTSSGLALTPTNNTAPSGGTNTLNVINFSTGTGGNASGRTTNGINFVSATGYKNFLNSPNIVIDSSGNISGAGTISMTGNLTIGVSSPSHIISNQTTAPTVSVSISGVSAGACTSCTDSRGTITTTGTAIGTGTITVNFNTAYASAPVVIISPSNLAGQTGLAYVSATSTTSFTITTTVIAGLTPSWSYMVMQ